MTESLCGCGYWLERARICVVVLIFLCVTPVAAKFCGDDVDGQDVACECGDVLVSDIVLGGDPIASQVCDGDGLHVRAASQEPITIDFAGKVLRGSGRGDGLLIIYGGAGGAVVMSSRGPGLIENFGDGISAPGSDRLRLLENVTVRGVKRDGIRVRGHDYVIRRSRVTGAGRDGFVLAGRGYQVLSSVSSESGRHGFAVMGHSANLGRDTRAVGSRGYGYQISGGGHQISGCSSTGGAKSGIEIVASDVVVEKCVVENNQGSGIDGHGMRLILRGNRADGNGGHGIHVRGDAADGGGNSGTNNGFVLAAEKSVVAVQCRVGGVDCR